MDTQKQSAAPFDPNDEASPLLSKLDEMLSLLRLSCKQQQEILSKLNAFTDSMPNTTDLPYTEAPEPMDIPEIPSIEFPFRPEDLLTCPKCHMMQSSSHDACSHCGVPFLFLSETKPAGD